MTALLRWRRLTESSQGSPECQRVFPPSRERGVSGRGGEPGTSPLSTALPPPIIYRLASVAPVLLYHISTPHYRGSRGKPWESRSHGAALASGGTLKPPDWILGCNGSNPGFHRSGLWVGRDQSPAARPDRILFFRWIFQSTILLKSIFFSF